MNPYEAPVAELEKKLDKPPKYLSLVYFLIILSFVVFLIEELLFAILEAEELSAMENYVFIPIWGGILYWVTTALNMRKHNPKNTFLILAVIVTGMSIYDPLTQFSIYTGIAESTCFLGVYFILRKEEFVGWFGKNA